MVEMLLQAEHPVDITTAQRQPSLDDDDDSGGGDDDDEDD